MPKSKGRRKPPPKARETQAAQRRSEGRRKLSYRGYVLRRVAGWSLVGLGVTVGASHWLAHLELWSFASQGVMDLVAGYPVAVALGVAGAVILSKV